MKSNRWLVAVAILAAPVVFAQAAMKEDKPGLLVRARIKPEAARATALKRIPAAILVRLPIAGQPKECLDPRLSIQRGPNLHRDDRVFFAIVPQRVRYAGWQRQHFTGNEIPFLATER